MLRKALLACPKTNAAIFPRAFESSFTLGVIAMSFPALRRRRGLKCELLRAPRYASLRGTLRGT